MPQTILRRPIPAGTHLLKVNNYAMPRSGFFVVIFEHTSYPVLVFLLLTLRAGKCRLGNVLRQYFSYVFKSFFH